MAGTPPTDISKLVIDNNTYNIKDATARQSVADLEDTVEQLGGTIGSLAGIVKVLGKTTTQLTDQCTTATVTIGTEQVTAQCGDIAFVEKTVNGVTVNIEYLFDGTKWSELGSTGTIKALAFKDGASGSFTPAGTVSAPTVTVTPTTDSVSSASYEYDADNEALNLTFADKTVMTAATATASQPTFTGTAGSVSVS